MPKQEIARKRRKKQAAKVKSGVAKKKKVVQRAKKDAATDVKLGIRKGEVKKGSDEERLLQMQIRSNKGFTRQSPKPKRKRKFVGA